MLAASAALVAFVIVVYAVVAKRLDHHWITAPMVFVGLGLLLGPPVTGWVDMGMDHEPIHLLAELTLVLVLFADASRIDLRSLRRGASIPIRLLGIGMPLTIGLGTVGAKLLLPELTWLEAGVLGALLAPTDAALGQAVVSSLRVPARIRQALNVESGLNDGIALPAVFILTCLASASHDRSTADWLAFVVRQVGLGPLAGIGVGLAGAKLVTWARRAKQIEPALERVAGLALAVLAWAAAEVIGGNGFIAAFVGGMTFGHFGRISVHCVHEFLETEGELLMMLVFLMFGASLLWPAIGHATWAIAAYVGLSLTVVRMAPVALSTLGAGLKPATTLFLGWFGPRGLATVLFGLLVVEQGSLPHAEVVEAVAFCAAGASVFAHGLTALPGVAWYARRVDNAQAAPGEHVEVPELPTRFRSPDR